MNPGKVDRRIPYYVLPGCEYMLDAGNACDADSMEIPGGCCPIGFECQQKGNGKVSSASGVGGSALPWFPTAASHFDTAQQLDLGLHDSLG
jgi:hypothetical protein